LIAWSRPRARPAPDSQEEIVPEVELEDVTLAYDVVGEGAPILLVAGCGQPAMAFSIGLVPLLVEAGYQVVTFDNRGVPPSSMPAAPYSIGQMAVDALALLDHLGIGDPVRIAGHSLGGWIAETLVVEHPQRVRAAALMGSANRPTAWEKAITLLERDLASSGVELPRLYYALETIRYLPYHDLQDDAVVDGWLSVIGDLEVWPNPGRLGQYQAALAWSTDPARTTAWPSITVPCLVMSFEYDIDSPPAKARQAADAIPGAEYVEIAGASHLGFFTHARHVGETLIEYFDRH
jgi:pimeloyl-ACP methyl ester carboxylesterase